MAQMTDLLHSYHQFVDSFESKPVTEWSHAHMELPAFMVGLYLFMVFKGPDLIQKPWNLKPLMHIWNLLLAVFSMAGAYNVVPTLFNTLSTKGFRYTICESPFHWYSMGAQGFWVTLFIYSKFPELLDTAFLVFQKKKVIFLHWFHHCTVLLYCWHAYSTTISAGIWFAGMNYCVHSIMYMYYFLTGVGIRNEFMTKVYAPITTIAQLTQMVVGIIITVTSARIHWNEPDSCHTDSANYKLGLCMYASYFILFAVLFYNKYIAPSNKKVVNSACNSNECVATDAAGLFRPDPTKPKAE